MIRAKSTSDVHVFWRNNWYLCIKNEGKGQVLVEDRFGERFFIPETEIKGKETKEPKSV